MERKNKWIIALGAIVTSLAFGYGFNLDSKIVGALGCGFYWLNCQ